MAVRLSARASRPGRERSGSGGTPAALPRRELQQL